MNGHYSIEDFRDLFFTFFFGDAWFFDTNQDGMDELVLVNRYEDEAREYFVLACAYTTTDLMCHFLLHYHELREVAERFFDGYIHGKVFSD